MYIYIYRSGRRKTVVHSCTISFLQFHTLSYPRNCFKIRRHDCKTSRSLKCQGQLSQCISLWPALPWAEPFTRGDMKSIDPQSWESAQQQPPQIGLEVPSHDGSEFQSSREFQLKIKHERCRTMAASFWEFAVLCSICLANLTTLIATYHIYSHTSSRF